MPIFEYQCKDCNSRFEILHKSSTSSEEIKCPKCSSNNYKKLLSTFSPSVQGSTSKVFENTCAGGHCHAAEQFGGCPSGMCGLN